MLLPALMPRIAASGFPSNWFREKSKRFGR
jgi:hypothetical protein